MSDATKLTQPEIGAYYEAFDTAVREAWKRGSGLILAETRVAGVAAWIAAYPDGHLTLRKAAEWAHSQGIQLAEGDVYLTPHDVGRTYSTFG